MQTRQGNGLNSLRAVKDFLDAHADTVRASCSRSPATVRRVASERLPSVDTPVSSLSMSARCAPWGWSTELAWVGPSGVEVIAAGSHRLAAGARAADAAVSHQILDTSAARRACRHGRALLQ